MLSENLAAFISESKFESLPGEVITKAKNSIMDWLGTAAAGASSTSTRAVFQLNREEGGNPISSLVGTGEKTGPLWAALINSISSHSVEMDDLHRSTLLHPGAAIIPAALAAAEKKGNSGKELIVAVVIGYDIAIRIAEAVNPSHIDHFYGTGTCGTFGSAAAVARLSGLDNKRIVHALGSAGTQASGLNQFFRERVMSRHLNAGKAAMNGMMAAFLAEHNFSGATRILEGEHGFFRAFSRQSREKTLQKDLGKSYKIMETSYKLYPSVRFTHGGVDLALRLLHRGVKHENIELVRIKTYQQAKELVGKRMPATEDEAKESLPFCIAAALVYGPPVLESFSADKLHDPNIERILSHCTVEVDPELELIHPEFWPTNLEIIDRTSHIIKEHTDYPKGDPENPATAQELQDKFRNLFSRASSAERTGEVLSRLLELEEVEDIRQLELYR